MLLRCVAIDDEPLALELIKNFVAQIAGLQLLQTFDDAIAGGEFLRKHPVDLLFMDINMPDISGIELVKSLEVKPLIIFTTGYKKFAHEGFELDAVDYLLKPIDLERFKKAVNKAIELYQYKNSSKASDNDSFFVRSEYKMIKVRFDQIEYIEALQDYMKIYITNEKPILTLMTLKGIVSQLPEEKFQRIHRSYIIPLNKIKSIINKKVLLSSKTELPVSDSYIEIINKHIQKHSRN